MLCSELAEFVEIYAGDFQTSADAADGDTPLTGWRDPVSWCEVEAKIRQIGGDQGDGLNVRALRR